MKVEMGKEYRMRCGREWGLYSVGNGGNCPVHGWYRDEAGTKSMGTWTDGGAWISGGPPHPYDLIEVRPRIKRTVWMNVYPGVQYAYASRELADEYRSNDRQACYRVDIDCEVGHGLDVEGGR